MKSESIKGCKLLAEVVATIAAYGILWQIGLLLLARRKVYASAGLWIGIALAIFLIVYMYLVLAKGLQRTGREAAGMICFHGFIRYGVVLFVYGAVLVTGKVSPLSCFAGIMGLKVAAYMQPVWEKLLSHRENKNQGVRP